ncbi:MAG: pirin family protein [Sphingobacteriia bacterium]|nr:pirin family protein [Sphingobacteriia bacterium]
MILIRKSKDRGNFNHGWLQTSHTFSFADYYNSNFIHFRNLRVINEDIVKPSQGFPTHSHKNMEIITYVINGELEHKDSLGNGSVIKAGDVQYMSAGNGVTHSEFNSSNSEELHLLQIWIMPNEKESHPKYTQIYIPDIEKQNKLRLIISNDGRDNSITIKQDANIYACILESGSELLFTPKENRGIWIQIIKGTITVNNEILETGDGARIEEEKEILVKGIEESEFLLFDLK